MTMKSILHKAAPVLPVLTLDDSHEAVLLAKALYEGGIHVLQVALRTPEAFNIIRTISRHVPNIIVGAAGVLNAQTCDQALAAGASFVTSPGCPTELITHAKKHKVAFLPGVATPTEIIEAVQHGYEVFRLFPSEAMGGVEYLKQLLNCLPAIKFCPCGGITPSNVSAYLALPNVICVGGSWLAPKALVTAGEWSQITTLARATRAFGEQTVRI